MKRGIDIGIGVVVIALLAANGRAEIAVGDKPALSFKSVEGKQVDLKSYRGKMVLVDFWFPADSSKAAERRLVDLYRQRAEDGFEVIGICCDRQLPRAQAFIKELGMTWPQFWDAGGYNGRIQAEWEHRRNGMVLIGPDGTVLWMGGGAAQVERALTAAMVEHPPTIVDPDLLAKANGSLDAVEKALAETDAVAAMKTIAEVPPEAVKNKAFAARLAPIAAKVKAAAGQVITDIDGLIGKQQFVDAITRLRAISGPVEGTPLAKDVQQRIRDLQANPAAKAQLQQAQREKEAADALAAARKLRDDKQHEQAYLRLKALVQDYPDTKNAESASAILKDYEQDADFMQRMKQQAIDVKAKPMLSLARSYAAARRFDQARQKYQELIEQFSGTPYAQTAKEEMAKLGR